MMAFHGRCVLLDVEGTTSSIRFVYETMFPYARRHLEAYLDEHWDEPATRDAVDRIARDAGHGGLDAWRRQAGAAGEAAARQLVREEVLRLMDGDVKATGLKQLQGLIWRAGFEGGELRAHLYEDVAPALRRWREAGLGIRIYSSGSVEAQRLFFGHTVAGDLLPFIDGHHDTTTGPKKEPASYRTIAQAAGLDPAHLLFLSDVPGELDAARDTGLRTALCLRPGNAPVPPGHGHPELRSFEEIAVRRA